MPLGRRQRVATVGAAAVATALSLAACSSSSSSSAPASGGSATSSASSSSGAALSGTLNGSGSTLQLTYQQAAIQAFKTVQSGMTVNYGAGGSGKGRTDLASGVVNYAASDSPISAAELPTFNGKTVLYFPVVIAPVTLSYNLSGPQQAAAADRRRSSRASSRARSRRGTTRRSRRTTPGSPCPAPRSPSQSAPTPRAPRRTSPSFSSMPRGDGWTLGTSSTIKWPSAAHAGNGNGGVASDHQVHPRGYRVRGLLRRQGLRADLSRRSRTRPAITSRRR